METIGIFITIILASHYSPNSWKPVLQSIIIIIIIIISIHYHNIGIGQTIIDGGNN